MSQVPITIKIDADLKKDIQKLAQNMGLSVSAIIENKLREVRNERRVVFEEELTPSKRFAAELDKIQEDVKADRNIVGPFKNVDEAFDYLNSSQHAD